MRADRAKASKLEVVLVRMPPDLHAAIIERARQEDRTMAQVIRRASKLYLARKPDR